MIAFLFCRVGCGFAGVSPFGFGHAPHRTALYSTRKRFSEEYIKKLDRRILEKLKPAGKIGADVTSLPQSKRDRAWFSAGKDGKRQYAKIQSLSNLETFGVFKATRELNMNANVCQISSHF